MKDIKYILFTLIISLTAVLYSQTNVTVQLRQPPPNQLGVSDLWNLSLNNTTGADMKIYLTGTVTEEKDGMILEGKSKPFTIKPGITSYKYNDFKDADLQYSNVKYKEIIMRTGSAPEGTYTICISAFDEIGEVAGREACIIQPVMPAGSISLISPEDGAKFDMSVDHPDFVWLPLKGAQQYAFRITEIHAGQSPDEAIKNNRTFFLKDDIKTNSFQYPPGEKNFEPGKKYAWVVSSGSLESEVRSYQVVKTDEQLPGEKVEINKNKWTRSSNFAFIPNYGQFDRLSSGQKAAPEHSPLLKASLNGFEFSLTQRGLSYFFVKPEENEEMVKKDTNLPGSGENIFYEYRRVDINFKNISIKKENIVLEEPDNQGVTNYFFENCPQGIAGVKSYRKAIIKEVYRNVDLILYGNGEKGIKYEFVIKPGGKPSDIDFEIKGAKSIHLKDGKYFIIKTDISEFSEGPLKIYYKDTRISLKGNYDEYLKNKYRIKVEMYDNKKTLVIDPPVTILWGTYYGALDNDGPLAMKTDNSGNVFACGYTYSIEDFTLDPGNGAYYQGTSAGGTTDAYIVKFDNNGKRIWATYYGGSYFEYGTGVAINLSMDVYITGYTTSDDFPNTNEGSGFHQPQSGGGSDFFILRFDNDGIFKWGTYFGGSGNEGNSSVAIDNNNFVYISGNSNSSDITSYYDTPFLSAHDKYSYPGHSDAILISFDVSNNKKWVNFYGGSVSTGATSITMDNGNNIVIAGWTMTGDLPLAGAGSISSYKGNYDIFIAKFNFMGGLMWSTYLGGTGQDGYNGGYELFGSRIIINQDNDNNFLLTSNTNSSDFPVTNCTEGQIYNGDNDVVITRFSNDGNLIWSRYLGGSGDDFGYFVLMNKCKKIFVMGSTFSVNFPLLQSDEMVFFDNSLKGTSDGFITKLQSDGTVSWSSYIGTEGTGFYGQDWVMSGAFDHNQSLFLTGEFHGINPSPGALVNPGGDSYFQPSRCSADDVFFIKFSPYENIALTISPDAAICIGGSAVINVSGALSYTWSPAAGLNITTGASVVASPISTTVYTVTGTDANGCTASATVTVSIINPCQQCDLFQDTYDNPALWTGVRADYIVNGNVIQAASGTISVTGSKCEFDAAIDNCDIRVWRNMGVILPATWQADFDYKYTAVGNSDPIVGHDIFALTAGTLVDGNLIPLSPINNNLGNNMCNEISNQDAVSVDHTMEAGSPATIGLKILVKKGDQYEISSDKISIYINTIYFVRLERINENTFKLSVYSDPSRLNEFLIDEICFVSHHNPTQLQFLQHSNIPQGFHTRKLTGSIDNTCITNRTAANDPCTCINSPDNLIENYNFDEGNPANLGFTVDGGPGYGYVYVNPVVFPLAFGNYTVCSDASIFTNQFGVPLSGTGSGGAGNFLLVSSSTNSESFWKQSHPVVPNTDYVFCAKFNNLIPPSAVNPDPDIAVYIKGNADVIFSQLIAPTAVPESPDEWTEFVGYWNSGSSTSAEISMKEFPGSAEDCWYIQINPVTNSMFFNAFTLEVPTGSVSFVDPPQTGWSVNQTVHYWNNKSAVEWKMSSGYTYGPVTLGKICFNPVFINSDMAAWFSTNSGSDWTCPVNTQIDFHLNPLCRYMTCSNANMICLSHSGNNYLYNFTVNISTPVNATITGVIPSRGSVGTPSITNTNPVNGSIVSGQWAINSIVLPYGLVSLKINYTLQSGATCSEYIYFDVPSCSQTSSCPKVQFIRAGFNTALGVDDIIFKKKYP